MKPQVERMQHSAPSRDAEVGFEVCGVVPHQRGHALAALEASQGERLGQRAGPAVEFGVRGTIQGAVGPAGDHFDGAKELSGTLENDAQDERKLHHHATHGRSPGGLGASYHKPAGRLARESPTCLSDAPSPFIWLTLLLVWGMMRIAEASASRHQG